MDFPVLAAVAAAVGSMLGATASITTTLISQRNQSRRAYVDWQQREREALYKEFITEASIVAIDALMQSMGDRPDPIIRLYGVLSRIRLVSGEEVLRQGEACCRRILDLYGQPRMTTHELRLAVVSNRVDELDPLRAFSNACRNELVGSSPSSAWSRSRKLP
jgi:hypothetical protein